MARFDFLAEAHGELFDPTYNEGTVAKCWVVNGSESRRNFMAHMTQTFEIFTKKWLS